MICCMDQNNKSNGLEKSHLMALMTSGTMDAKITGFKILLPALLTLMEVFSEQLKTSLT